MDDGGGDPGGDEDGGDERGSYRLGPDGAPVDAGESGEERPEPETAVEYRRAARRALGADDAATAIEHLDRAVELARADGDDALAAGALTDRGNVRMERADPDEGDPRAEVDTAAVRETVEAAVADYAAALEHDPESRGAYFNRGLARARLGDRDASTADLERAADLGAPAPFLVRGNAYAEAGADEHAREDFSRAIDRTDAARAYFNRGNANRRLGDREAAVADYEAALDRADELPDDGLRVLVELADASTGEAAATYRVRAAFLAVAHRDIWRGVALAERALDDATRGTDPWLDAAAVVLAGAAIRDAAGYGVDAAAEVDAAGLRQRLADATLPDATAALVAAATGDGTGRDVADGGATSADLAGAVVDGDHDALRAAAAAELVKQLRLYR